MGDGIAAFFGVPAAHEDDPERAARAALAIVDVVTEYAREVEAHVGHLRLQLRVGINTGETAVGLVGARRSAVGLRSATRRTSRRGCSASPSRARSPWARRRRRR